ncbi:MAG TPA: FoF1 ATP synthase subunit a, partial [bacterium]|nr:FoF1 ATP synthase subunit a [bacterium]
DMTVTSATEAVGHETEAAAGHEESTDQHETAEHDAVLTPIFRPGTADLNTTFALAIISVVTTWVLGIKHLGFKKHLSKFFNLKGIHSFVGILEFVGEFSKILSFSFRLFGNIFAGEVLLAVIGSLIPVFVPLPFIGLEIFVGAIQALVFALLSVVFLSMAVAHNH